MKNKILPLFAFILILTNSYAVVSSAYSVIPSGEAVGVIINTKGLLVTDITEIIDSYGNKVNAAQKAGIKKGDRIISADGMTLENNEDLAKYVINRPNEIALTIIRNNKTLNLLITPTQTNEGYKLGIWVRDSTAGIGTITYIDPSNNSFAGLGHGICDISTDDILTIKEGNIQKCNITSPIKGERGKPGELNGVFSNICLGSILKNTQKGIYGSYSITHHGNPLEVADPDEVLQEKAYILANVDGKGIKQYSVQIKKIIKDNTSEKNMVIEVTDKKLINITGGIVQGMSGAPIIQNNKLVGAITHVFVNNPKQGYGIFATEMLKTANN